MKTIGKLIVIGLLIALLGFIFKITLIPGGGITLFSSLSFLSVLTFIQLFLSFDSIKNNNGLKIISALMSFTLSISFVAILLIYQWWPNSLYILNFCGIMFIISTVIFIIGRKKYFTDEYKKYVIKNLLIPWIFIFVFGGLYYLLSSETFYNTFNYRRVKMTYQEYEDNFVKADNEKE